MKRLMSVAFFLVFVLIVGCRANKSGLDSSGGSSATLVAAQSQPEPQPKAQTRPASSPRSQSSEDCRRAVGVIPPGSRLGEYAVRESCLVFVDHKPIDKVALMAEDKAKYVGGPHDPMINDDGYAEPTRLERAGVLKATDGRHVSVFNLEPFMKAIQEDYYDLSVLAQYEDESWVSLGPNLGWCDITPKDSGMPNPRPRERRDGTKPFELVERGDEESINDSVALPAP